MTEKMLNERYKVIPMERSFHLITPMHKAPRRSLKRFVGIPELARACVWDEKPEEYYHRGFAVLAWEAEFRCVAVYCKESDITAEEIEERLASASFGCFAFEVWS